MKAGMYILPDRHTDEEGDRERQRHFLPTSYL